jgi:YD repeat-containing protein
VLTIADARGTISNTYKKLDLVQVVDRMGFTNPFAYDALRRMTAQTNPSGITRSTITVPAGAGIRFGVVGQERSRTGALLDANLIGLIGLPP